MRIVTHEGKYHADDILAVATLLAVYPEAEVIRSRDEAVIAGGDIVVDVGFIYDPSNRRFDHHQPGGAGTRTNGIPYAGFGLIWREWGRQIAGSAEAAALIDEKLVAPVDAHDNGFVIAESNIAGVRQYTISDFFYSYYFAGREFMEAVKIAEDLLKREIEIAKKEIHDNKVVEELYASLEDKRLIVLDDKLSWHRVIMSKPEPLYVVYPRPEGNWGVAAVPTGKGFDLRKPLPAAWGGKKGVELQEVTGVNEAFFCHKGLFMCAAVSKDGAILLAQKALEL